MSDSVATVQHDIEQLLDELDVLTEEFGEVAVEAVKAEMAYKRVYHRSLVVLAERGTMANGTKSTADWRHAQASLSAEVEEERHRIMEARVRVLRESLTTKRTRLDALRTLAANVRGQTEFAGPRRREPDSYREYSGVRPGAES